MWTQPSGGRAGSVMHSWGNSSSLPIASCKRGAERPDLAAVMLRPSSGNAARWMSPFNTSWADFLTGAQGLRGLRLCDHRVGAHAAQSSASFQSLVDPLQRQRCVLGAAFYLNSFLLRSLDFRKSTYSETREVLGEEQAGITDYP